MSTNWDGFFSRLQQQPAPAATSAQTTTPAPAAPAPAAPAPATTAPARKYTRAATTGNQEWDSYYDDASEKFGVDPDLLIEQARRESINFNPRVVYGVRDSPKGARGIAQFMPDTAWHYGLPHTPFLDGRAVPRLAIPAQAKVMRELLDRFHGNEEAALAAYNSGSGLDLGTALMRRRGWKETREYVDSITGKLQRVRSRKDGGQWDGFFDRLQSATNPNDETTASAAPDATAPLVILPAATAQSPAAGGSSRLHRKAKGTIQIRPRPGDSLQTIASRYDVPLDEVQRLNPQFSTPPPAPPAPIEQGATSPSAAVPPSATAEGTPAPAVVAQSTLASQPLPAPMHDADVQPASEFSAASPELLAEQAREREHPIMLDQMLQAGRSNMIEGLKRMRQQAARMQQRKPDSKPVREVNQALNDPEKLARDLDWHAGVTPEYFRQLWANNRAKAIRLARFVTAAAAEDDRKKAADPNFQPARSVEYQNQTRERAGLPPRQPDFARFDNALNTPQSDLAGIRAAGRPDTRSEYQKSLPSVAQATKSIAPEEYLFTDNQGRHVSEIGSSANAAKLTPSQVAELERNGLSQAQIEHVAAGGWLSPQGKLLTPERGQTLAEKRKAEARQRWGDVVNSYTPEGFSKTTGEYSPKFDRNRVGMTPDELASYDTAIEVQSNTPWWFRNIFGVAGAEIAKDTHRALGALTGIGSDEAGMFHGTAFGDWLQSASANQYKMASGVETAMGGQSERVAQSKGALIPDGASMEGLRLISTFIPKAGEFVLAEQLAARGGVDPSYTLGALGALTAPEYSREAMESGAMSNVLFGKLIEALPAAKYGAEKSGLRYGKLATFLTTGAGAYAMGRLEGQSPEDAAKSAFIVALAGAMHAEGKGRETLSDISRGKGFFGERLPENVRAAAARAEGKRAVYFVDPNGRFANVIYDPQSKSIVDFRPLSEKEAKQANLTGDDGRARRAVHEMTEEDFDYNVAERERLRNQESGAPSGESAPEEPQPVPLRYRLEESNERPTAAPKEPPLVDSPIDEPRISSLGDVASKQASPPPAPPPSPEDALYSKAVEIVRDRNRASTAVLQRALKIGYGSASQLLDRMEQEGIVGPLPEPGSGKPRPVLPSDATGKTEKLDALRNASNQTEFDAAVAEAQRAGATPEEIDAAIRPSSPAKEIFADEANQNPPQSSRGAVTLNQPDSSAQPARGRDAGGTEREAPAPESAIAPRPKEVQNPPAQREDVADIAQPQPAAQSAVAPVERQARLSEIATELRDLRGKIPATGKAIEQGLFDDPKPAHDNLAKMVARRWQLEFEARDINQELSEGQKQAATQPSTEQQKQIAPDQKSAPSPSASSPEAGDSYRRKLDGEILEVRSVDNGRISLGERGGEGAVTATVSTATFKGGFEKTEHKFSSTQVDLPNDAANALRRRGSELIPSSDIYTDPQDPSFGREENPHVTVKYGLHTENADEVRRLLADEPPIKVAFGKTSIFPAKDGAPYDVVKVDVDSPDLHRLNAKISKALKVTDTHPEYVPHATIAYVKKGLGKKYVGGSVLESKRTTIHNVTFSSSNGEITKIPLGGKQGQDRAAGEKKTDVQTSDTDNPPDSGLRNGSVLAKRGNEASPAQSVAPAAPVEQGAPQTEVVDKTFFRQFDTPQGMEMDKASDAFAGKIQGHIENGDRVTLFADGGRKKVPIVAVNRGMMQDAKGQRWGTLEIASGGGHVEIQPQGQGDERPEVAIDTKDAQEQNTADDEPAISHPTASGARTDSDPNPVGADGEKLLAHISAEPLREPSGEQSPAPGAAAGAGGRKAPVRAGDTGRDAGVGSGGKSPQGPHTSAAGERGDAAASVPSETLAATDAAADRDQSAEQIIEGASERAAEREPGHADSHSPALAGDYHVDDIDAFSSGGLKTKFQRNIDAIQTLRRIQAEGRMRATPEEQEVMARFIGWGQFPALLNEINDAGQDWVVERQALKALITPEEFAAARASTKNAHYTAPQIVRAIWSMVARLGFKGGRVIEPSMGIGNFYALIPREMRRSSQLSGVEIEPVTAQMAKLLYPSIDIHQKGFEKYDVSDGFFDLAISNVPFGNYPISDRRYPMSLREQIHDYFFVRSLDAVRDGGLVAFITSTGTLDKPETRVREHLAGKADLVAAIRLPANTFLKEAGTAVVTDILILRKRPAGETLANLRAEALRLSDEFSAASQMMEQARFEAGYTAGGGRRGPASAEDALEQAKGERRYEAAYIEYKRVSALLQKANERVEDLEKLEGNKFQDVVEVPDPAGGEPIPVNEYFAEHPEMIIGRLDRTGTMWRADSKNVTRQPDFEEHFERAIDSLPGSIYQKAEKPKFEPARLPAPDEVKQGAYMVKDGKVYTKQGIHLIEQRAGKDAISRITAMIALRDVVNRLFHAEQEGLETASETRAELNKIYDAFIKRFGVVHSKDNLTAFADDPDRYKLMALEVWDAKSKKATKSDIFTRPTIAHYEPATSADNITDALSIVLNETGGVDLARLAELLDEPEHQIAARLTEHGLAYNDPRDGWTTRALYLSGEVRRKLLEARAAARMDEAFTPNVEALEKVQPEDKPYSKIDARLGASWIPASDIQQFMAEMMNTEPSKFFVSYSFSTATWHVGYSTEGSRLEGTPKDKEELGTPDRSFPEIVKAAMDDRAIRITRSSGSGANRTTYVDRKSTTAAQKRVKDIRKKFKRWIWTDDERRERLHRFYNDTFNNVVKTEWDGSHLTAPGQEPGVLVGMNQLIRLRKNQMSAAYRAVVTGRLLAAHEVGTGKTFTMVAAGMERKRLRLSKKPAIACLNSNVGQVVDAARLLYPNARILAAHEGMDADKRQRTITQIATGDWDLVVLTHDNLDLIPMSPETQEAFMRQELQELEDAVKEAQLAAKMSGDDKNPRSPGNRVVKDLENRLAKKAAKLDDLLSKPKDNAITLEETGIDFLMVDEAHKFKSLPITTTRGAVKGIPTSDADRATNMLMRTQYILEKNGGQGILLATGTPISNTMAEIYVMQRFLQARELAERGILKFDAWANNFGQTSTKPELKPSGQWEPTTRFNQWTNMRELSAIMGGVMDVAFGKDIEGIVRPKRIDNVISVPMNPDQRAYLDTLRARAEALKRNGRPEKGGDNWLVLGTDATKAAIDMRLVNRAYPDDPTSKLNKMIQETIAFYFANPDKTQALFSDTGVNQTGNGIALYGDIIKKLVAAGIPRAEIIDFSQFKPGNKASEKAKAEAMEALNQARARIAIGSTEKLGTGVNIQTRLAVNRNLDAPYTPAAIEQRDGRAWRDQNENKEVQILRYTTEASFDTQRWQLLDNKQRFIHDFLTGELATDSFTEEDGRELSYAQVMAMTSGNPLLIKKMDVEAELVELEGDAEAHEMSQLRLRDQVRQAERYEKMSADDARDYRVDADLYERERHKPWQMLVDGKAYTFDAAVEDARTEIEQRVRGEERARQVALGELKKKAAVLQEQAKTRGLKGKQAKAWVVEQDPTVAPVFEPKAEEASELEKLPATPLMVLTRALRNTIAAKLKEAEDGYRVLRQIEMNGGKGEPFGHFRGFDMVLTGDKKEDLRAGLVGSSGRVHTFFWGSPIRGQVVGNIQDELEGLGRKATEAANSIRHYEQQAEQARKLVGGGFAEQELLEQKRKELAAIELELATDGDKLPLPEGFSPLDARYDLASGALKEGEELVDPHADPDSTGWRRSPMNGVDWFTDGTLLLKGALGDDEIRGADVKEQTIKDFMAARQKNKGERAVPFAIEDDMERVVFNKNVALPLGYFDMILQRYPRARFSVAINERRGRNNADITITQDGETVGVFGNAPTIALDEEVKPAARIATIRAEKDEARDKERLKEESKESADIEYMIDGLSPVGGAQDWTPVRFGPGAANLGDVPQETAMRQFMAAMRGNAGRLTLGERLKMSGDAIAKLPGDIKTRMGRLISRMNATSAAVWGWYRHLPAYGTEKPLRGDRELALQRAAAERAEMLRESKKDVPRPVDREAIQNYLDAGGDMNVLAEWAAHSTTKYKAGYERALQLTDEQKALATNLASMYESYGQMALDEGVLRNLIDDYANRRWDGKNAGVNQVLGELQNSKLQVKFRNARQRLIKAAFDGEQAGMEHVTKDAFVLAADYQEGLLKVIADRAYVRALTKTKAADGRPYLVPTGAGRAVKVMGEDEQGNPQEFTTLFITPRQFKKVRVPSMPEKVSTNDYEIVNHPALSRWVWADASDTGTVYVQGNLAVHPKLAKDLKNMIGRSQMRDYSTMRFLFKANSLIKAGRFALPFFHATTEGVHSTAHGVNPIAPPAIDWESKLIKEAVRHGLMLTGDRHALDEFREGIMGAKWVDALPVIGTHILGPIAEWLFESYIPRLKAATFKIVHRRNVQRYGWQVPAGIISQDQLLELSARQVNNAYGELPYRYMARDPRVQDAMRLIVQSPDFTEARFKTVVDFLKPYGREQLRALLTMFAIFYLGSRLLNKVFDNDYHWDSPFTLVVGGREYGPRIILGDVLHAVGSFREFLVYRLSPVMSLAVHALSGRDAQGHKVTMTEAALDEIKSAVPFGMRKAISDPFFMTLLNAFGISAHKHYTKADEILNNWIGDHVPDTSRDTEVPARAQLRKDLLAARSKGDITDDVMENYRAGKLDARTARELLRDEKLSSTAFKLKHVPLTTALDAYEAMTAEERTDDVKEVMTQKFARSFKDLTPEDKERIKRLGFTVPDSFRPGTGHYHPHHPVSESKLAAQERARNQKAANSFAPDDKLKIEKRPILPKKEKGGFFYNIQPPDSR